MFNLTSTGVPVGVYVVYYGRTKKVYFEYPEWSSAELDPVLSSTTFHLNNKI
jgi:hypothetical protein